jgi:hypothetical protein
LADDTHGLQLATNDVYGPEFIFFYMVIPSLNNPSRNIDICLRPLIEELNQLWSFRTLTFDVLRKHDFQMKVALIWIINDFHVHKMVFGWRKHEKLTCLYCMENKKVFTLTNGGKVFFLLSSKVFTN